MDISNLLREIVVHILGFVAFFFILKRFAFKPIGKILEERRSRIEGGLRDAENARLEADRLKQGYEKKLESIEAEGRKKVQEAFDEARRMAVDIQERGRVQAKAIVDKGRQGMEMELEKARISLRNEVAQIAVELAERAIRTKLSDSDHDKIVNDFIEEAQERL